MNIKKTLAAIILPIGFSFYSVGQNVDSTIAGVQPNEQAFLLKNGETIIYKKPKPFSFITQLPNVTGKMVSAAFNKKSIKPWALIGASTGILFLADEAIANNVQQFSKNIHLHSEESNKILWSVKIGGKETTIIKAPGNLNTALYQVGQGFPGLLLATGLFVSGKINHNYRSLSVASQLTETFILMGVTTQVLKRISGRESPEPGNENSWKWKFLPSFKEFQKNTPKYDAYPSGHLATLMSTVTTLALNYPEKKWIMPVGCSLTGLVGLAMINNNAHWASDYPLAIGLGYLCAKTVAEKNRRIAGKANKNFANRLSYSFQYSNGHLLPAVIVKL
ncbi:MAG: phosphatase PAP2 family protein [Bacteroidetes bacterium]|nr:phosphatase PAP2 family protein [Bacteroidota bacterium]MBS1757209.1 phosphatase PAP2 family protein [Bacteroidota bacterium]